MLACLLEVHFTNNKHPNYKAHKTTTTTVVGASAAMFSYKSSKVLKRPSKKALEEQATPAGHELTAKALTIMHDPSLYLKRKGARAAAYQHQDVTLLEDGGKLVLSYTARGLFT